MKKLLLKFMSVFTAVLVVLSVVAVSVSAENILECAGAENYTSDAIETVINISESGYGFTDEELEVINSKKYFMRVVIPNSYSNTVSSFSIHCIYSDEVPTYKDNYFYFPENTYRLALTYNVSKCTYSKNYFGTSGTSTVGKILFFDEENPFFVSSLNSFMNYTINSTADYYYPVLYYDNFNPESEETVDIKVNVDGVSNTLPTSIDISENPNFYIDITNNTENAIQFVAWISDTPASSGAYNSYSSLNWTYSTQQWAYVYHGTWADNVHNALDIYGNIIDTVDLIGICWWKDILVNGIDNCLPTSYYSQDNISSPYHYIEGFGGTFKEKFSFNTATISKDKEYYFNIVYRSIVQVKVDDDGYGTYWLPVGTVFHDNFEDLNYYELGYCTAFSLTTDTIPESSTDTNISFPSDFSTTIKNTRTPSATIRNDGNITLSGGDNDLNNSINFNPSISNSNYNGGVTINNNVGGSNGGYTGDYGDFDGDVSKLEELLNNCKNFFNFLKTAVNSLIPEEMTIFIFSCFTVIVFLRILGR